MWWSGAVKAICSRRSGFRECPEVGSAGLVEIPALPHRQPLVAGNPVRRSELTEEESRIASENKDLRVP